MHKICPKCGSIAQYDAYYGYITCTNCTWTEKDCENTSEQKLAERTKLRVWHIPQIPGKPFFVYTDNIRDAKKIMDILSAYDLFQLENRIKPDFANVNGVEMWDETEQEWTDWCIETENDYFDNANDYLATDEELNRFSDKLYEQLTGRR